MSTNQDFAWRPESSATVGGRIGHALILVIIVGLTFLSVRAFMSFVMPPERSATASVPIVEDHPATAPDNSLEVLDPGAQEQGTAFAASPWSCCEKDRGKSRSAGSCKTASRIC